MPVSLFLTSLSQFFIAGSFFLEGKLREKFKRLLSNRIALLIIGIWIMHVIGLAWTENLQEGFKDLRIKLPLLILPFVLGGSEPLSLKQFRIVCGVFIFSVFSGSMVSMAVLTGLIEREINTIRDIFIFNISHIRFALFTCLCILLLTFDILSKREKANTLMNFLKALLVVWLFIFLIIMESLTGIVILSLTGFLLLNFHFYKSKRFFLLTGFNLIALVALSLGVYRISTDLEKGKNKPIYEIDTTELTSKGNAYYFNLENPLYENGFPVWVYVCDTELVETWSVRSRIPLDSLDQRGNKIRYTLVRFLASKGLKKNADAVMGLSEREVHSIERGIANHKYQNVSSIRMRYEQVIWELINYSEGKNPSGHSVTQRIEFWKAAAGIISKNPLIGTGTGDMKAAYAKQYDEMNSKLSPKYRLKAHNQYIAITVAFGITGLAYFLFTLIYSLVYRQKYQDLMFLSAWCIAMLSMITEDTLETQPGATFFAYFISLFLFGKPENRVEGRSEKQDSD